jgi:hypothetical protein
MGNEMSEFRFTFVRYTDGGMEEQGRAVSADTLEEATVEAEGFCQRNDCRISRVEWFDQEAQRWRQSDVCYA